MDTIRSAVDTAKAAAMPLPKTYRAVVLDEVNSPWEIREVELKHPSEGEILVKSKACGVCFSDVATQGGHMGPMAKWPVVPGHEVIGDVVEVGPGVKKWKVGDRVGGPWHGGHDGTCRQCNEGFFQGCENELINGVSKAGGFAEYVLMRAEATVRISKDADVVKTAPLLCAGVTTFNAMRRQNVRPGATVAVQGLGGLGHLALQFARKMGYRVVAISSSDKKKDFATQLGAHHYIDTSKEDVNETLQKYGGASMIVCTAPNPEVINGLTGGLAPQGKLLILAPVGDVSVNTVHLVVRAAVVTGFPSGHAQDSEDAIDFANLQGIECMVEPFPFEKVKDAIDHLASGKARFRCVLTFD